MMRKLVIFALAASGAACSNVMPQKAPEPDTSPTSATAVFETHVVNGGVMGFLPFESTEKRYVRTNMQREDSDTKSTGTFAAVTNFFAAQNSTNIERLDRNVLWTLTNSKKEYTECPLYGCPVSMEKAHEAQEKKSSEPKAKTESGCTMRVARTNFDVKATGEKRDINGFQSEQYKIAWLVTLEDNAKRTTTSTLNIDLWTTPVTAEMRKALAVERAFNRGYAAGAPHARRFSSRSSSEVLPLEVSQLMLSYLSNGLKVSDRATFVRAGRQFNKIKGHPVSTHIEWSMAGTACASQGSTEASSGPILSYTIEEKTLKLEQVHDSMFSVPKDYKLVSEH